MWSFTAWMVMPQVHSGWTAGHLPAHPPAQQSGRVQQLAKSPGKHMSRAPVRAQQCQQWRPSAAAARRRWGTPAEQPALSLRPAAAAARCR